MDSKDESLTKGHVFFVGGVPQAADAKDADVQGEVQVVEARFKDVRLTQDHIVSEDDWRTHEMIFNRLPLGRAAKAQLLKELIEEQKEAQNLAVAQPQAEQLAQHAPLVC